MGLTILLDSVILIDHLRGIPQATGYLRSVRGEAAISVITRAEVLAGVSPPDYDHVIQLLDSYSNLAIDAAIATLAAELRRQHKWKLPDAFQAALATHHGLRFATRNTKDFPPDRHAFVDVPYQL